MLKAIIICPDSDLRQRLSNRLDRSGRIEVSRVVTEYPDSFELNRIYRSASADVIFLSGESITHALEVVRAVLAVKPKTQVIAVLRNHEPSHLLHLMRAGVRDCLSLPLDPADVEAVLQRAASQLQPAAASGAHKSGNISAFLPAKPGVGASTVATNTALAAAAIQKRVLLADLDFSGGMLRFMLKLAHKTSIADACERAAHMEESIWQRLVDKVNKLDVIHAGPFNPASRPSANQIRHLAAFWRNHYDNVFIDLSGEINEHCLEALHESQQIFMVCTTETSSLYQAKEKLEYLKSLDLGGRASLIVNRYSKDSVMTPYQVEELVGTRVHAVLGNDYLRVQKALHEARGVERDSPLGKQFVELAKSFAGNTPEAAPESKASQLLGWLKSKKPRPAAVKQQVSEA